MNEYDDLPTMAPPMERDLSGFTTPAGNDQMPVPYGGASVIIQNNRDTTAKRVAVPRDSGRVFSIINASAASFGDQYTYAWDAKDKRTGRKSQIEGGTIKLANMLQRAYGNCMTDCDVSETPTHLIFKAYFVDFETGMSASRLFQQRKSQNTGMGDVERQADIVFQIGQSKAIRNVVLNALSDYATHAIEESKKGMLKKFADPSARELAHAFIDRGLERYEISEQALIAVVGRRRDDWDARNLAKAYTTMRAVVEGMVSAAEAFPSDAYADEINKEREKENDDLRSGAARRKSKAKDAPAAEADKPAADPAPEPEKAADPAKEEVKPEIHQQPGYKATGPEAAKTAAPADAGTKVGDDDACDDFLIDLKAAATFEAIETVRAQYSKLGWQAGHAMKLKNATVEARERVKDAARAAAKAPAAAEASTQQDAKAEPAIDEGDVLSRIEEMFEGLNTAADIGEAHRKAVHLTAGLSDAGKRQFEMILATAHKRAEAKAAEVRPGPAESTMLFGED